MKKNYTNNFQYFIVLVFSCILLGFSAEVFASGIKYGEFSFIFNGVAALATFGGIFSIWMGYRLFTKGIVKNRGELKAKVKFVEI